MSTSTTTSNRVQPGDLITAEFINSILDRLDALEGQLNVPTPTPTSPTFPTTFHTLPTTFHTLPTTFHTLPTTFHTLPTTFHTFPTFATTLQTFAFQPESDVTMLPGIGSAEKDVLNKAGITNIQELSEANPEAVAAALNTSNDHATTMVSMAANVLSH